MPGAYLLVSCKTVAWANLFHLEVLFINNQVEANGSNGCSCFGPSLDYLLLLLLLLLLLRIRFSLF
jgi:hypothetical protein